MAWPADLGGEALGDRQTGGVVLGTVDALPGGQALPELAGKLSGNAIRVPTPNVSMAILNLNLENPTTVDELNGFLRETSMNSPLSVPALS